MNIAEVLQSIQSQCNAEMWQQCDMKEQNAGVEDFEQCIECAVWTCGIMCNVLYTHSVCRDTVCHWSVQYCGEHPVCDTVCQAVFRFARSLALPRRGRGGGRAVRKGEMCFATWISLCFTS